MMYHFKPQGVCSTQFHIEVSEEGFVESLSVDDGCDGYGQGMSRLVKGRHMDELIALLDGIPCDQKATSCPDQFAKMLLQIKQSL
ncbi:MAG: TIGR03905 family TSCPD domain-containing protein [Clostridiales bacterium]|nr:TIGR03905 family TSCPD domain-containing protein [Clostridiales bacterium]